MSTATNKQTADDLQDDRPARYVEDGVVIYRASAIGQCPRMFVRLANGFPPAPLPPFIQEIYAEGHKYEEQIMAMAGLDGQIVDRQKEYNLPLGRIGNSQVVVRCHVDGRHAVLVPTILEAKKFRPSTWATWKRHGINGFPHYEWQTSVIHAASGEDVLLIPGHLTTDDKGNKKISEVDPRMVVPRYTMLDIKRRVKMIELACQEENLDVECEVMYPCPMFRFHDKDAEQRTEVTDAELVAALEMEREDNAAFLVAKAHLEVSRAVLRDGLIAAGYKGEHMTIGQFNVTHVNGWVEGGTFTRAGRQNDHLIIKAKKDKQDGTN